ncbi:hypothetical protein TVAG_385320 [Trichomonas vaginalis G3]|uniref:Right handed beta helix domain-containing protein n=1 Tax=Trichomonas vaginalis (strain ATCC PRA-98 / G3) TaxID=412133 RepID=A2FXM4_TRIV3|nr:hypothetical protein TVAGG3_0640310 [Trichomonas vaginalis G3]EAX90335.1 hypothetical protein TVAG_385320 [Trichomonas vaginalis G3]KAI5505116.1 hypothetical protein TVAGG3_0640310 [Trichomonas vaginalis G3]|eukprot:XP_001303265.1 hypothetical protein [Trichomonas vaginalis G3]
MKMKQSLILLFYSGPSLDTWTLFYENEVITESNTENKKLNPTEAGNYYVTTCLFNGIQGVVVNIDKGDQTKLLISISGFNGTKATHTVYSYQGSCVIYRTCATKSLPTGYGSEGGFLYSKISESNPNNKNIFQDSTVFDCGDSINVGYSTNYLEYGNVSYSRNNITNNKCIQDVSLQIVSKQKYNISQSSFIDNKANEGCFCTGSSGPHQFYLCNIIRNNANNQCFWLSSATVTFESCSIKNNNCTQTFYFLHYYSCSATIINSDYDGRAGGLTITNSINNYYNELPHLSTRLCEAVNKIENKFEEENDIKKLNNLKNYCISVNFYEYRCHNILDISHISSFSIWSLNK